VIDERSLAVQSAVAWKIQHPGNDRTSSIPHGPGEKRFAGLSEQAAQIVRAGAAVLERAKARLAGR
jgi:hypothetical protein